MINQLDEKIGELIGLYRFILEKVKAPKRFRSFRDEVSSLSNALHYLNEVEINFSVHHESRWQKFWTQFSSTLDDCEETLRGLDNI